MKGAGTDSGREGVSRGEEQGSRQMVKKWSRQVVEEEVDEGGRRGAKTGDRREGVGGGVR